MMTTHFSYSSLYPEKTRAYYRRVGAWNDETLWELLEKAPGPVSAPAVLGGGHVISRSQLMAASRRLAATFASRGVVQGDRVVLALPNGPEFFVAFFACQWAGVVPVMGLASHRPHELTHLIEASAAKGIVIGTDDPTFAAAEFARRQQAAGHLNAVIGLDECAAALKDGDSGTFPERPDIDPDALAVLQLSGGTTGPSKLIPRTHNDYGYSIRESVLVCGLTRKTVYLAALPVAHNFPLTSPGSLGALAAGGTVVTPSAAGPAAILRDIATHRVTITGVVPSLALAMCVAHRAAPADLTSLRALQVGGAPFSSEAARHVAFTLGVRVQQVYGMAEGLVCYTRMDDPVSVCRTTQGRPMSAVDEVRIVDSAGVTLPLGDVGELTTRGPYTIRSYYAPPGSTPPGQDSFTADGFYRTGDLARQDEDGNITVVGRIKEQINRGGEKLSPNEIEGVLLSMAAVAEASVIGVDDELLGQKTHARIVPASPEAAPTLADVRSHFRVRGVAAHKVPDSLEVRPRIDVSHVGKYVAAMDVGSDRDEPETSGASLPAGGGA